jgi:hypothetical protein
MLFNAFPRTPRYIFDFRSKQQSFTDRNKETNEEHEGPATGISLSGETCQVGGAKQNTTFTTRLVSQKKYHLTLCGFVKRVHGDTQPGRPCPAF